MSLKVRILQFAGLITWAKNVQKNFQCNFCDQWSISFILKSFLSNPVDMVKILLTVLIPHMYTVKQVLKRVIKRINNGLMVSGTILITKPAIWLLKKKIFYCKAIPPLTILIKKKRWVGISPMELLMKLNRKFMRLQESKTTTFYRS